MKRLLLRVYEDIKHGENIDLFAAVALAAFIFTLDILGKASSDLVASVALATLGLLAVGLLLTRYKMDSIHRAHDIPNLVQFSRQPFPSLESDLRNENTKEIWMLGLVLRGTIYNNFYNFKQNVQTGTKLRVMISNRNKINTDTTVMQFTRGGHATGKEAVWFPAGYEETINRLREIRLNAPQMENVKLKLLDFVPSFSLYIFPKAEEGGVIYVEIYCYKSETGSIPKFRISQHENPQWYKHFVNQFELMWKDAKEHSL